MRSNLLPKFKEIVSLKLILLPNVKSTVLKPGKNTNGHKHEGIEEVYIFQSGFGSMEIDNKTINVKEGDTVIIPDGAFHKVFNGSNNEDFSFIAIFNDKRNH